MKAILIILFPLLLSSLSWGQGTPVAPKTINYQGKLTDASGGPLGGATGGMFRLRFELFGVASGGERGWAEEREVVVIGGLFNVALGGAGGTQVGTSPRELGATAFAGPDRFLQITILSGPGLTGEQTLVPRQQLASVPYALVSQTTDRAAVATLAESLIPELTKALNPPGTIITYAGAVIDNGGLTEPVPGYLLCNGAVIDATTADGKYAALKTTLGIAWGNAADENANTVNLPDLRGVFLRGWNGIANDQFSDPDRDRTYSHNHPDRRVNRKTGGNTENNVGSFQMDQFKSHNHNNGNYRHLSIIDGSGTTRGGSYVDSTPGEPNLYSAAPILEVGGFETRPKNANVVYLIKY